MSGNQFVKIGERPPNREDLYLLPHKYQVVFALFCARQVEAKWKNIKECVKAIDTVERWLDGKASAEECRLAADTANNSIRNIHSSADAARAVIHAAHAVIHTTYATSFTSPTTQAATNASCAAYSADYATDTYHSIELIEAQWSYYYELLHFDDIAEETLLGGKTYVK